MCSTKCNIDTNAVFRIRSMTLSAACDTRASLPGGDSELEPPDPIPNSEVKRLSADGSVGSPHVRVGHCQASNMKTPVGSFRQGFFLGVSHGETPRICLCGVLSQVMMFLAGLGWRAVRLSRFATNSICVFPYTRRFADVSLRDQFDLRVQTRCAARLCRFATRLCRCATDLICVSKYDALRGCVASRRI